MMVLRRWSDRRRNRILAEGPPHLRVAHARTERSGSFCLQSPTTYIVTVDGVEVHMVAGEFEHAKRWFEGTDAYRLEKSADALTFWSAP